VVNPSKLYDIDSLNEIKRSSELASKKVEITNQVFDMLVKEIKTEMFPLREGFKKPEVDPAPMPTASELLFCEGESSMVAMRGKKRGKPRHKPKVKELYDGLVVDKNLANIMRDAIRVS
jgi:hypothetical protein